MSKDECLDTCRKLAEIRNLQFSRREVNICHAIDYADDNRFLIGYADSKRVAA
jgi:hypothetical protein